MTEASGDDPVLAALDELIATARHNVTAWMAAMERIERVRDLRRAGIAYSAMVINDGGPRLIDVVAENQERLTVAAAQYRRAIAAQLHAEGLTIADIARLFGVTRQRVAALLRPGEDPGELGDATAVAEEIRDTRTD